MLVLGSVMHFWLVTDGRRKHPHLLLNISTEVFFIYCKWFVHASSGIIFPAHVISKTINVIVSCFSRCFLEEFDQAWVINRSVDCYFTTLPNRNGRLEREQTADATQTAELNGNRQSVGPKSLNIGKISCPAVVSSRFSSHADPACL